MDGAVDWKLLSDAITYFAAAGYKYVEVPWSVPSDVTRVTCPEDRWIVTSSLGDLVGSAEQSFMHLKRLGVLGDGKFVACTPCFRNEDVVDELHQRTFMKVELYQPVDEADPRGSLERHVEEVMGFYRSLLDPQIHGLLKSVTMRQYAIDIELAGVEIGSYGLRSWDDASWMYGTAIAEPRFSTVRKMAENRG